MEDYNAIVAAIRIALSEVVPQRDSDLIYAGFSRADQRPCIKWPCHLDNTLTRRARRLAMIHLKGPEWPVLCDTHYILDDVHAWDRCLKVEVRDALVGRTCGAD